MTESEAIKDGLQEIRERAEWYPSRRSIDAVPWYQVELALSDRRYLLAEVDALRAELTELKDETNG